MNSCNGSSSVLQQQNDKVRIKEDTEMVIQSNMSSNAIVEVWADTEEVFNKYNIPFTNLMLETLVETEFLPLLLQELNSFVGSSTATCIEGG